MRQPRGYFCRKTKEGAGCGKEVPLDHWGPPLPAGVEQKSQVCTNPPAPLPWIRYILSGVMGDEAHSNLNLTATRLLTCPRKVILEDCVPLIFDPMTHNSIAWGRAAHKAMQDSAPPGTYAEAHFPLLGQPKPIVLGVPMSGTMDFFSPDMVVIEDYKTHSETAHKFKASKPVDPELRAQISIYKLLAERSGLPIEVKAAAVWHGAMTSANHPASPWFRAEVPFMSEAEIGKVVIGAFTVQQIVDIYKRFGEEFAKLKAQFPTETYEFRLAFDELIKKVVPPVGQDLWGGKMCQFYCGAAKPYCDDIERG